MRLPCAPSQHCCVSTAAVLGSQLALQLLLACNGAPPACQHSCPWMTVLLPHRPNCLLELLNKSALLWLSYGQVREGLLSTGPSRQLVAESCQLSFKRDCGQRLIVSAVALQVG